MMNRRTIAAGAAGLAVAATLAGTTPALAATSKDSPLVATSRGNARFYNVGDKFHVCDAKKDGYTAEVNAYTNDAYGQHFVGSAHTHGVTTCATLTKSSIPEGTKVTLYLEFVGPFDFIDGGSASGVA